MPAHATTPKPDAASLTSGGVRIAAEWFAPNGATRPAPGVLLLHGADGLAFAGGYRIAAGLLAASGFGTALVHYLDRTGDRRASYGRMSHDFPLWTETVRDALTWLGARPGIDPGRLGVVGISLGAALAFAAGDPRIRAIVDYFGPLPEELARTQPRLPPTLILHGQADAIVPVAHARAVEALLQSQGTPYEISLYPDQGHGFTGAPQADAAARATRFLEHHLRPKHAA